MATCFLCCAAIVDASFGEQLFKLTVSDGTGGDQFGKGVAIGENVAVVGAFYDDDLGDRSGSAYLFDLGTGAQTHKLLPDDAAASDRFGASVGIGGDKVVVGSPGASRLAGAAYLFDAATGNQLRKLTPADSMTGDFFGSAVAMSGNTIIVGAQGDDDHGLTSGSAYLFDATTGAQLAKLTASDGAPSDFFGVSVGISGGTAIVGAHSDDDNGSLSGSAYLFDVATGSQRLKLTPNDGTAIDYFGYSVAISGNTAIVGAITDFHEGRHSGSAYLFDVTTGEQIAKLTAGTGEFGGYFGASVGISGDVAIVGATSSNTDGVATGAAYLFDAKSGARIAKLIADDRKPQEQFGGAVDIRGNMAIVGAYGDDRNTSFAGSAYLFTVVPEPTNLAFVVLWCVAFLAYRAPKSLTC